MTDQLNCDSDLYLYAKHWYKRGDLKQDLHKIIAKRCALYPEQVRDEGIITVLLSLTLKHLKDNENRLFDFIKKLNTEEWDNKHWKLTDFCSILATRCLSELSIVKTIDGAGNPIIQIDPPDYKLLPPGENVTVKGLRVFWPNMEIPDSLGISEDYVKEEKVEESEKST